MSNYRAIETRYAGCHFRSRLEARWAVFFDHLGVEWQYEPQGFVWDSNSQIADSDNAYWGDSYQIQGGMYLPDFWLPSIETWFEVKGDECTEDEKRTHYEFALVSGQRHITAVGDIPSTAKDWSHYSCNDGMTLSGGCDINYHWCVCPWCGKYGIEFEGRGGRICGSQRDLVATANGFLEYEVYAGCDLTKSYTDKGRTYNDPYIFAAYEAARSARFEHGQAGAR